MNQKAKFRIGVLVYLLLCIVLYVCIYVVPKVSDIFVETYVAEYGSLQIGEESEALFVRNERLYTADGGGAIDRVISGGSLMRKGSRIVTVGGQGYYSGEKGIVSYFYDGLESVLTPDTMATADSSFLQKVKQKPQEGEPDYSLRKCVSETASRGLDGAILAAFILGLPANEIVIPLVVMIYLTQGKLTGMEDLTLLRTIFVDNGWTAVTAVCFVLFSLMHWPCSTTLLTIHKETGSWKWTGAAVLIPTICGVLICAAVSCLPTQAASM